MSIADLVQAADGCLVLAEIAHPSHEYVCPTCTQRLQYKTKQDKTFFSHLPGESQACRAAIPKTNYHRVLTTCQTRYKWKLHVECATQRRGNAFYTRRTPSVSTLQLAALSSVPKCAPMSTTTTK